MKRTPLKSDPAKVLVWLQKSRKPLRRGSAMPRQNAQRAARRAKAYRKVLASDFHKQLRYAAFLRSGGLCECDVCATIREGSEIYDGPINDVARAVLPIPVWFAKRGKEPWQRFRSMDGELHHLSYKYLGDENPDELRLVQWVWKDCHKRLEAEHNTRRRYMKAGYSHGERV